MSRILSFLFPPRLPKRVQPETAPAGNPLDPFAEPAPEGAVTMVAYDVRQNGIERFWRHTPALDYNTLAKMVAEEKEKV